MDNEHDVLKYNFGLVGKDISYSFSRAYFSEKFKNENLPHTYQNFDLQDISEIESEIASTQNLKGLNVTIPYKEAIIPYLDKLNKKATKIGAVNTIKISKKGKLIGYNTDYYGFKHSIKPHLEQHHKSALILGTGGASKAIAYALKKMGITYHYLSRTNKKGVDFTYNELTEDLIEKHKIIINCTPLGTFPDVNICPNIPYDGISKGHILYDLIYNPEVTKFLEIGGLQGATTINGLDMLKLQAEKSWDIWNQ
ncbi:shikimate dehydrogenase family protein [Winogradskyella sp. A3E31]|uniref:shikimate dehydrogenase family protein n=1 Tax=Winogradskyella sp. A3E31 TaxID=3349637 RepID=UPI00398B428E